MKELLTLTFMCPVCTATKAIEYDEPPLNEYVACKCDICGCDFETVIREFPAVEIVRARRE